MPTRGNTFRTNSFKEEPAESSAPFKKAKVKDSGDGFPKFNFDNDRAVKIVGLFLLLLALYFLLAFTSHIFTWQDDQSYVIDANGGWANLFKNCAVRF